MGVTQMNVRLDRELKRAGDAVLAGHGYTPSCAVRALWEYLSVHAKLPDALERVLRQGDLEAASPSPDSVAAEGARIAAEFYERAGIEQPTDPVDYEVLRSDAAHDQLRGWGFS